MQKIRSSKYAQEALQQFNMTVVELEDDASAPAPSIHTRPCQRGRPVA